MLCKEPFVKSGQAYPCGMCLPCLYRRRKVWKHRIMLETTLHSRNAFATLTYAEDKMPAGGTLVPRDLQLFLKRLRKDMGSVGLRYFAVGEYGDKNERPHYHAILFGYQTCLRGRSSYSKRRPTCCSNCDRIRDLWGLGHAYLGTVTVESADYVCGYMTKNMRRTDDVRLRGRWPEFTRMSLKPGIGYGAMIPYAMTVNKYNLFDQYGDVPAALRSGPKVWPLGTYLRRSLRKEVGISAECPAPDGAYNVTPDLQAMSIVKENAKAQEIPLSRMLLNPEVRAQLREFSKSVRETSAQRLVQLEAREARKRGMRYEKK